MTPSRMVPLVLLMIFSLQSANAGEDISSIFADRLYKQGRYREAQIEYERMLSQNPNQEGSSLLHEKNFDSLLRSQQFDLLLSQSKDLSGSPSRDNACLGSFYEGRAFFALSHYSKALNTFNTLPSECLSLYTDRALYWGGLTNLKMRRFDEASDSFKNVSDNGPFATDSQYAEQLAPLGKELPLKSPTQAATLNLVLPGAGYLYAGYPRTALTAFIVTGLFVWGTVSSIHAHNSGAAMVFGLFSFTWYAGGAYGSARAAKRVNTRTFDNFYSEFKER